MERLGSVHRWASVSLMRLTKFTHACVRLERDGQVLVIDPGTYTEPTAVDGAHAVLVTHEHADHVDAAVLKEAQTANPALAVYAHVVVVDQLSDAGVEAQSIAVGDRFSVAGFGVRTVGGEHAEVYDGLPGCPNLGLLIDEGGVAEGNTLYHPGDSVFVPDGIRDSGVATLLVPVAGPWLKLAEAIDFVRAVRPLRAFPIHDAPLSPTGCGLVDRWLEMKGDTRYARLAPGESVELSR